MAKVVQGILGVLAGCVVAAVAMGVAETIGRMLFPLPSSFDLSKPTTIAAIVKATPAGAFAFILAGWAVGTFIGSSVAAKIAPLSRLGHGMAVGGLLLASSVANMAAIPHPLWVRVVGVLLFLPTSFLGASLGSVDTDRTPLGGGPARG